MKNDTLKSFFFVFFLHQSEKQLRYVLHWPTNSLLSVQGMKVSCTHFQCSAGAFSYLRDHFSRNFSVDMSHQILNLNINLMLVSYIHLARTHTHRRTKTCLTSPFVPCRARLRSVFWRSPCWTTGRVFSLLASALRLTFYRCMKLCLILSVDD